MKFTNLLPGLIYLLGGTLVEGASRYLAIPFDDVDVIEVSPMVPQFVPRYPRQAEYVPALVSGLRHEEPRDHQVRGGLARSDGQILDYVDFGAHSGDHGAYSWYADFPARRH